ncbi:L-arabinokinase-like isoform X1 [Arachis duranensis]|uniref:L-arabinokinase-like isoform X1 n=2 Tax=Arachis duranensis TaxID=130453 RepID=A0A6P5N1D1_ARADU|nr:L-arabinokinase-like isoform X1 [Arachis duranensis]
MNQNIRSLLHCSFSVLFFIIIIYSACNIAIIHNMVAIKMGMKQQEEYDGDGAAAVSSTQKMVFAYYVTGHGFGHATRVAEVVRHLILAGHDVHVVTAAPEFVFTNEVHSPRLFFRKVVLECGAVQSDALTVDPLATLERYTEETVKPRASILAKETEWLKFINADLVVSDVVSTVCRVAADVGIPSVCVANFSWDIIYLDYVMAAGPDSRSIVLQIAEDYSNCNFLIRLPGYCPMPAFRNVIDVPLVVRRLYKSTEEVREELGIADNVKLVILNFGGQPSELKLKEEFLPSGWLCLVCGASDTQDLPANFKKLPKNVYTPDIIAASDCVIGKLGYGSVSEALAYKCPFVFVHREYFNEEPFLRKMLEHYQGGIEMSRNALLSGHWKPYLERAMSLKPCYEESINGGEVAAQILQEIALGKYHASVNHSEAKRLCDAAVPDDQRRRAIGQDDILIPEWYANAGKQLGC